MLFNPKDYTTVFLSYDEPNCEDNYRHLLTLNPNALRVHGVKGSDTAHKEVAKLSLTDSVIIVDGDNFVKPSFFDTTIELKDNVDLSTSVLSFSGYNTVNGTSYGNGGIKVWPTSVINSMRTHENAEDPSTKVDFSFDNYLQLNMVGSNVCINASPKQAWRAGFREGVKLLLNDGLITYEMTNLDWRNYDRLWSWMHVGSDAENGIWAIFGARLAVEMMLTGFDYSQIQDFDYLDSLFDETVNPVTESERLGALIYIRTLDDKIEEPLSIEQSKQYKESHVQPIRSPELFLPVTSEEDFNVRLY